MSAQIILGQEGNGTEHLASAFPRYEQTFPVLTAQEIARIRRFGEERNFGDGEALFEHFSRTRAIRRGIVEIGQDSAAADFGRPHANLAKRPD